MIDKKIIPVIQKFFASTETLIEKKIIRSSKYTADIAEYLCSKIYGLDLCKNQREAGYDAMLRGKKYQIKINNSIKKTNQDLGNPKSYDFLLLLLTSKSKLYNTKYSNYFICIYKLDAKKLITRKYIAKNELSKLIPAYIIDNDFAIKKNVI